MKGLLDNSIQLLVFTHNLNLYDQLLSKLKNTKNILKSVKIKVEDLKQIKLLHL